ncbi:MAG: hypothetical protein ACXVB4_01390 [Pseudobdellovibrionaceae bacterium]
MSWIVAAIFGTGATLGQRFLRMLVVLGFNSVKKYVRKKWNEYQYKKAQGEAAQRDQERAQKVDEAVEQGLGKEEIIKRAKDVFNGD